jgi:hypothetical protein
MHLLMPQPMRSPQHVPQASEIMSFVIMHIFAQSFGGIIKAHIIPQSCASIFRFGSISFMMSLALLQAPVMPLLLLATLLLLLLALLLTLLLELACEPELLAPVPPAPPVPVVPLSPHAEARNAADAATRESPVSVLFQIILTTFPVYR